MSKAKKTISAEQFDLFLPYIADLNFRDQREMMERPFFSLSKRKRVKPIDYTSPDGKIWVHVSANPDYGMATIWDADILIYCASVLADMVRRGQNDIPRTLHVMPYDILRSLGRPTNGRSYELLGQAMDRLVATTVKTNIRAQNRREATFGWLDGWTQLVDERNERARGMTIELSNWFYEGVLMKGGILAIDREYFSITGGRERWLYKVARKHAGGAGQGGFAITMPTLFEKSGAEGAYRRFKFEMLKLAKKNALPGFDLSLEESADGEPKLRMTRIGDAPTLKLGQGAEPYSKTGQADDAGVSSRKQQKGRGQDRTSQSVKSPDKKNKTRTPDPIQKPRKKIKASASKTTTPKMIAMTREEARGKISGDTLERLRKEFPGWDLYALHAEFERWVDASPSRTPVNWQAAFIGFVRRHHNDNKNRL